MTVTVLLVAVVALVVVAAVAWPLTASGAGGRDGAGIDPARQELEDEIDRSLRAIREIEADHSSGDLDEDTYRELRARERARAAELLRRRDAPPG